MIKCHEVPDSTASANGNCIDLNKDFTEAEIWYPASEHDSPLSRAPSPLRTLERIASVSLKADIVVFKPEERCVSEGQISAEGSHTTGQRLETEQRSLGQGTGSAHQHLRVTCKLANAGGEGKGNVDIYPAPVKMMERMREKVAEYEAEGAHWPLAACILDPVRASIVCDGPAAILEVAGWFLQVSDSVSRAEAGTNDDNDQRKGDNEKPLSVKAVTLDKLMACRLKNKFSFRRDELVGGYRDLMICAVFTGPRYCRAASSHNCKDTGGIRKARAVSFCGSVTCSSAHQCIYAQHASCW